MNIRKKQEENNKIVRFRDYKSKFEINLGIVIFGIVFIYMIATIVIYITTPHVSAYEIREGTILEDTKYTGLIIRDEQVFTSSVAGYIQYYCIEGNRVNTTSGVYSISAVNISESISSSISSDISDSTLDTIESKIQLFNSNYSSLSFSDVYTLKNDINTIILDSYIDSTLYELGVTSDSLYYAQDVGNVSFVIDGFEDVTIDDFSEEDLNSSSYKVTALSSGTQVDVNTPIYKIVVDEEWSLILDVTDTDAERLAEMTYVDVEILEDDVTLTVPVSLIEKDGNIYAKLDFDSGMIRYISNRYIDVELVFASVTGLKIPISSVVVKEFYEIPTEYVIVGGNSSTEGVLQEQDDGTTTFVSLDIYYTTDEYIYALPENLGDTPTIVNPDTLETLTIRSTTGLEGVYNINKGYAIFECIEILIESDEYYIITNSSDWTVKNYDYIVLDGSLVEEYDIVF